MGKGKGEFLKEIYKTQIYRNIAIVHTFAHFTLFLEDMKVASKLSSKFQLLVHAI